MEYLVSIEDRPYHHWQIDLLIEGFRLKGMEDQLVVAIAEHSQIAYGTFGKNLLSHPKVYRHVNFGRDKGNVLLNKAYAVATMVEHKKISQPFCLIDPDMVLLNPIAVPDNQFTFCPDWALPKKEEFPHLTNIPIGGVMAFNEVPAELFTRVVNCGLWQIENQTFLSENGDVENRFVGRSGWAMAATEFSGGMKIGYDDRFEATLLENDTQKNFIHYRHGLPPVWTKLTYQFDPDLKEEIQIGGCDPFDGLMENNPTAVTNEMQKVIKHYRGKE
jgi:hypothetical protein